MKLTNSIGSLRLKLVERAAKSLGENETIRNVSGRVGIDSAAFVAQILDSIASQIKELWERADRDSHRSGERASHGGSNGGGRNSGYGRGNAGSGKDDRCRREEVFWNLIEEACYRAAFIALVRLGMKPEMAETAAREVALVVRKWLQEMWTHNAPTPETLAAWVRNVGDFMGGLGRQAGDLMGETGRLVSDAMGETGRRIGDLMGEAGRTLEEIARFGQRPQYGWQHTDLRRRSA